MSKTTIIKLLSVGAIATMLSACASGPMEQKEYKSRLDYCTKIEMDVQIEKNEKSKPTQVDCIDKHGSVFDSKIGG